jgi:hypothetical protein
VLSHQQPIFGALRDQQQTHGHGRRIEPAATTSINGLGACLSIPRGRERGRFPLSRGGADVVGSRPNEEATTTNEGKSARSLRVGWDLYRARWLSQAQAVGSVGWGVCGVARLALELSLGRRRAPCIRSRSRIQCSGPSSTAAHDRKSQPTRLTQITQTGS